MASEVGRGAQVRLDGDEKAAARGALGGGLYGNLLAKRQIEDAGQAATGNGVDGSFGAGIGALDEVLLPNGRLSGYVPSKLPDAPPGTTPGTTPPGNTGGNGGGTDPGTGGGTDPGTGGGTDPGTGTGGGTNPGGGTTTPSPSTNPPPANAVYGRDGSAVKDRAGRYVEFRVPVSTGGTTPPVVVPLNAVTDRAGRIVTDRTGAIVYRRTVPDAPVVVTPDPTPVPPDPTPPSPPPVVVFPTTPYLFLTSTHPHVIIEAQDGVTATVRLVRPIYLNSGLFKVEHRNTGLGNNNTFWSSTFGYLTIQNGQPAVLRDITSLDDGTYATKIFQGMTDGSFLQLSLVWKVSPSATGTPPAPSQPVDPQTVVFFEDFEAGMGTGALSRSYGTHVNTGGTLLIMGRGNCMTQTDPSNKPSAGYGFGNGLFEFRCKYYGDNIGDKAGPAIILWPSSDVWPGPEIDLGELMADGTFYMAIHWKDPTAPLANNGQNKSIIQPVPKPFDHKQWHTYAARLQTDKITLYVDGVPFNTNTTHPAPDFAHGGENHTVGIASDSTNTGIECDWIRWTPEALLPPL